MRLWCASIGLEIESFSEVLQDVYLNREQVVQVSPFEGQVDASSPGTYEGTSGKVRPSHVWSESSCTRCMVVDTFLPTPLAPRLKIRWCQHLLFYWVGNLLLIFSPISSHGPTFMAQSSWNLMKASSLSFASVRMFVPVQLRRSPTPPTAELTASTAPANIPLLVVVRRPGRLVGRRRGGPWGNLWGPGRLGGGLWSGLWGCCWNCGGLGGIGWTGGCGWLWLTGGEPSSAGTTSWRSSASIPPLSTWRNEVMLDSWKRKQKQRQINCKTPGDDVRIPVAKGLALVVVQMMPSLHSVPPAPMQQGWNLQMKK